MTSHFLVLADEAGLHPSEAQSALLSAKAFGAEAARLCNLLFILCFIPHPVLIHSPSSLTCHSLCLSF